MPRHNCMHFVRLVSSGVGVAVGLLACVTFAVPSPYQHIPGSALAFLSAVFAALCLSLHTMHHRSLLQVYHSSDTLGGLEKLGFFVFIFASALCAWFLFDMFYMKIGMEPFPNNPVISAVWSFMMAKWGIFLWFASRMYSRLISSQSLLEA